MSNCCDIEPCLTETIYVAKCLPGVSEAGEVSFGVPEPQAAHIEVKNIIKENSDGTELVTRHMIITLYDVSVGDRVWLPDSDTSEACEARQPMSVQKYIDPETHQISHYEVMV